MRSRSRWLLAIALVVLSAISLIVANRLRRERGPLSALWDAVPREARVLESRVAQMPWAPYRGPLRGTADATSLKLMGLVGQKVEQAQTSTSADAQHAAGVALLLIDRPEEALTRLQTSAEQSPHDAARWNDLAAAQYGVALHAGRPSLLTEALASCDRALQENAASGEALFNRALILERLGFRQEARAAWTRFFAVDGASQWAVEGRQRLAQIPETTADSLFKREQPRLEQAARSGDTKTVRVIVDQFRQRTRTFGESEYLGRWAEAFLAGNDAQASSELIVARAIGDALVTLSGESLLHDAVAAIDGADPVRRRQLAQTHVLYRAARIAYSKHAPEEAAPKLAQAAQDFARSGSPMSLLARYYEANVRFDQNNLDAAHIGFLSLKEETPDRYAALNGQVLNQLAICAIASAHFARAAKYALTAEERFHALGERNYEGVAAAAAASALLSLGEVEQAWDARIRAFVLLDAERNGDRLVAGISEAVRTELAAGRLASARALLRVQEATSRAADNEPLFSYALVCGAVLESRLGNDAAALQSATDAQRAANRINDSGLRARAVADARFAEAAAVLRKDPRRASTLLTQSLDHDRGAGRWLLVPEALLLRARAYRATGDVDNAVRDLDEGIALLERHSGDTAGTVAGTGALDAGHALFEEAIDIAASRHDIARVHDYGERLLVRLIPSAPRVSTLADVQSKLAGRNVAVLRLIALPDAIVALTIREAEATLRVTRFSRSRVAALVADGRQSALATLYDALLRAPAEDLESAESVIVIADPALRDISFAALYDRERREYLVQRHTVMVAENATMLTASQRRKGTMRAATLMLDASDAAALPDLWDEVQDVSRVYHGATRVPSTIHAVQSATANVDVLHIAGHTQRQRGAGDAAIELGGQVVSWRNIASTTFTHPIVVVLAACETLRPPQWSQSQPLSLGGGFIAAGASDVIGTYTPIADVQARELFRAVHEQLASGVAPAEALRRVQLERIARDGENGGIWRSIGVITRHIP